VTTASFDGEVLRWPGRVLAEFEDGRCYYCQQIAPFIKGLTSRLAGRVKVVKVDIQAEPALAARYGISATPTFIVFRKGAQLARTDGAPKNESDLEMWALQAS
jgi:thioredoxin 1